MKPLERIFFQACMMKCKIGYVPYTEDGFLTVRDVIKHFETLGFSVKRLWYYLDKWDSRGFYDYGVKLDLGWFEPDRFTGEYKVMYESIMKGGVQE